WKIYKNSPPTCGSQTPASSGNATSPGTSSIYTGNGADADNDPLTFNWTINGTTAPSSELNVFNASTSSQATFTPTAAYMGSNLLTMSISDGTDQSSCSWTVGVSGTCAVSGTNPTAPGPV